MPEALFDSLSCKHINVH